MSDETCLREAGSPGGGRDEFLAAVERQLDEFNRRSAHRETIIDRLHEENQLLRNGLRRSILDPVVADLLRLYDTLLRETVRLTGEPVAKQFASFADETELILDRCGIEAFTTGPGDRFEPSRHTHVTTVRTDDPDLHSTVEHVLVAGFVERETGQVRRPARVRLWRYEPPDDAPEEKDQTWPPSA
jgi:molecular chaperone GrpE